MIRQGILVPLINMKLLDKNIDRLLTKKKFRNAKRLNKIKLKSLVIVLLSNMLDLLISILIVKVIKY